MGVHLTYFGSTFPPNQRCLFGFLGDISLEVETHKNAQLLISKNEAPVGRMNFVKTTRSLSRSLRDLHDIRVQLVFL